MNNIRKYLKDKVLNNQEFLGNEKERNRVLDLLQRTVEQGESNSMLLIGPKGTGKTKVTIAFASPQFAINHSFVFTVFS